MSLESLIEKDTETIIEDQHGASLEGTFIAPNLQEFSVYGKFNDVAIRNDIAVPI